jgi:hypothetical protein
MVFLGFKDSPVVPRLRLAHGVPGGLDVDVGWEIGKPKGPLP